MTEYLERVGHGYRHDLWMVRVDGGFGQAQIYDGSDRDWEHEVERETLPWVGFSHERVIPVLSMASTENRLVIVHGDERGPSIHQMAALLTDVGERTRWAVDQIAGIAEAIAMMAWRQHGFVHRRANHEQIVVGQDGHARLRAPVAFVAWGKLGSYTGRGNAMSKSVRYMCWEQIRGEPLTGASDVHTLGSTLYKALTNRAPFGEGGTDFDTMNAIYTGVTPPAPTEIPAALAALVMRALARDPAARPKNPATFASELRRCMPEPLAPELMTKVAMLRPDSRPAPHASELIVGNRCAKQWDELTQTPIQGVRHCGQCQHDVVQVRSIYLRAAFGAAARPGKPGLAIAALVPLLGRRCVSFKDSDEN